MAPTRDGRAAQPPEGTRQLHRAYQSRSVEELARYYDEWSADYEDHMGDVGYLHPAMVASMVGRHAALGEGPVLDAGAGTGIMGEILAGLGQEHVIGLDASEGMLARAAAKGIYAELHHMFLGYPLDFPDDRFAAVIAAGVFTDGHAPLAGFDELVRVTRPGGRLIFSVARSYLDGAFDAKSAALETAGAWKSLDRTAVYNSAPRGDYLPSRVYVREVC